MFNMFSTFYKTKLKNKLKNEIQKVKNHVYYHVMIHVKRNYTLTLYLNIREKFLPTKWHERIQM